jgi:hypothetical protein
VPPVMKMRMVVLARQKGCRRKRQGRAGRVRPPRR